MPLSWSLDSSYNPGAVAHVLTWPVTRPSQFESRHSPLLKSPAAGTGAIATGAQYPSRVHCGETDHCHQWQPQRSHWCWCRCKEADIRSASSCLWSTLELGKGSMYSRKLIFHWWPSWDKRAVGGERRRGRWDDDTALQGSQRGWERGWGGVQSADQIIWSRNRWCGCNQRWEKERERFWVWRRSQ